MTDPPDSPLPPTPSASSSLQPRKLFRMHQLNLVTTSRACELPAPGSRAAAEQQKLRKAAKEAAAAAAQEDPQPGEEATAAFYDDPCMGMDSIVTASCSPDWESFGTNNSEEEEEEEEEEGAAASGSLEGAVSNITPLSGRLRSASPVDGDAFSSSRGAPGRSGSSSGSGSSDKQQQQQLQAAALVGRKLGEAAAAAAALGGRAGSAAAAFTIARTPFARSVAEQLEHAAEEGGISVATELMMTHGVEMAASALSGGASEDPRGLFLLLLLFLLLFFGGR